MTYLRGKKDFVIPGPSPPRTDFTPNHELGSRTFSILDQQQEPLKSRELPGSQGKSARDIAMPGASCALPAARRGGSAAHQRQQQAGALPGQGPLPEAALSGRSSTTSRHSPPHGLCAFTGRLLRSRGSTGDGHAASQTPPAAELWRTCPFVTRWTRAPALWLGRCRFPVSGFPTEKPPEERRASRLTNGHRHPSPWGRRVLRGGHSGDTQTLPSLNNG